eukprot:CAMPEP_0114517292 /NCGR_PEP_ID=MMETSP0109-20121206/17811_1 /TAXON_ID=29199 /ORGANISM="Chlorarachnion reptans, Strain CCCM449" /LENGTH=542 /DNA_ID=CAMNT_0001697793 /DNA_START=275 /DNA_END=1904 /DNA_ORIENTATION=+
MEQDHPDREGTEKKVLTPFGNGVTLGTSEDGIVIVRLQFGTAYIHGTQIIPSAGENTIQERPNNHINSTNDLSKYPTGDGDSFSSDYAIDESSVYTQNSNIQSTPTGRRNQSPTGRIHSKRKRSKRRSRSRSIRKSPSAPPAMTRASLPLTSMAITGAPPHGLVPGYYMQQNLSHRSSRKRDILPSPTKKRRSFSHQRIFGMEKGKNRALDEKKNQNWDAPMETRKDRIRESTSVPHSPSKIGLEELSDPSAFRIEALQRQNKTLIKEIQRLSWLLAEKDLEILILRQKTKHSDNNKTKILSATFDGSLSARILRDAKSFGPSRQRSNTYSSPTRAIVPVPTDVANQDAKSLRPSRPRSNTYSTPSRTIVPEAKKIHSDTTRGRLLSAPVVFNQPEATTKDMRESKLHQFNEGAQQRVSTDVPSFIGVTKSRSNTFYTPTRMSITGLPENEEDYERKQENLTTPIKIVDTAIVSTVDHESKSTRQAKQNVISQDSYITRTPAAFSGPQDTFGMHIKELFEEEFVDLIFADNLLPVRYAVSAN